MSAPCSRSAVGLADAIDADDVAEVARAARLDPGQRVLVHRRLLGLDAELPGAGEVGVGRRLAGEALPLGDVAVDDLLEQVLDPGGLQDGAAVGARRDDRPSQPGVDRGPHVAHRAVVRFDALLVDQPQHDLVLAVSEPGDRLGLAADHRASPRGARSRATPGTSARRRPAACRRRTGRSRRGCRTPGTRSPVALRPARAGSRRTSASTRLGVDLRGLRQHPVEVEEAGLDAVGEPEASCGASYRADGGPSGGLEGERVVGAHRCRPDPSGASPRRAVGRCRRAGSPRRRSDARRS